MHARGQYGGTGEAASMKPDNTMAGAHAEVDAALAGSTAPGFLAGGGEMGSLIRGFDWRGTPLGEPEAWPQSLKTAIRIMLTSRQPIWIGWGQDLIVFYNDPYKSIIGGEHPAALGQPASVAWRELWSDIRPLLQTALTGTEGTFDEQKLLIMERNGYPEETYYTFSYSTIPDDSGGTGGVICANSDDTARMLGERQLRLLREIGAATRDALSSRDVCEDSVLALKNDPYDVTFAFLYQAEPGGALASLPGASGISAEHLAAPVLSRTGEMLGGLFFGHPKPGVFSARAERIVEGIATQAATATDNARLYQAAQREIGEPSKAEEALRELNETLEARVVEAVADRDRLWDFIEELLVVVGFNDELLRVSPSWTRLLGHDTHWLAQQSYFTLIHHDDLAMVNVRLDDLRRTGAPVRFENRLKHIDGSWRWIAWTFSLDPNTKRIHGVGRDVTGDRQTQEALRHAEEALRVAQKMEAIGNLTGGVAHDFNNLLQVIGGNLQLLADDVAGSERPAQRVRNALAGVARGAKLASQLLAFGRRQALAPKVVNLGRFVRGLDDMLRRALGDGIEIETIVSGGLWNTLVDPFQVENALLNLAINARDAMDDHGKLTIEAGNASLDDAYARRHAEVTPGQYVMLAVTDTGSGMSADVQEHVFEPFFTTKPEGQGTGLGLSMVYGFVKQSGGHVKIYSELGHGTTIRLYLPRVLDEEDLETDIDAGPAKGGAETILIVEDDEDVRTTVVEMLASLGYRVLKAKDAQGALAIVESGVPIHLLFTDVVMPGSMRSTELARKVRERQPGIAVLFTSGYTDNAIVHAGRLDKGVALLSKPYSKDALARKLLHTLRAQYARPDDAVTLQAENSQTVRLVDRGNNETFDAIRDLRVLFVEDDELVRVSTAELLRTFGLDVAEAQDAEQAMRMLNDGTFDVLLTDVGLAGASGIELALDARARQPDIRVIFVTGSDAQLSAEQQSQLQQAAQLRKPFDPLELIDALRGRAE
jgi:PAS domain S-box-containing protein